MLRYLHKIRDTFFLQKIVTLAKYAPSTALTLANYSFAQLEGKMIFEDVSKAKQINFYHSWASSIKIDPLFFKEHEVLNYNSSMEKLAEVVKLYEFMKQISKFDFQLRVLNNQIDMKGNTLNFFSYSNQLDEQTKQNVKEVIDKYNKLLDDLKQYPEWSNKIREELGGVCQLLYNTISSSDKEQLFKAFDKQAFFK